MTTQRKGNDWETGHKESENRSFSRPATLKEILAIPIVKKHIKKVYSNALAQGRREAVEEVDKMINELKNEKWVYRTDKKIALEIIGCFRELKKVLVSLQSTKEKV